MDSPHRSLIGAASRCTRGEEKEPQPEQASELEEWVHTARELLVS